MNLRTSTLSDRFSEMVNSLKLAQRAELLDVDDTNLIETLYVDPLPDDGLLKQVIQDSTVFLVGRKGTGKSTIFARVQQHFRNSKTEISAYVDVKTLYGKSVSHDVRVEDNGSARNMLHMYQGFVLAVLSDLVSELKRNLKQKNVLHKLWRKKEFDSLLAKLEAIREESMTPRFVDADLIRTVKRSQKISKSNEDESNLEASGTASHLPSASAKTGQTLKNTRSNDEFEEYSKTLIREFNLNNILGEITDALKSVGMKKLHVILDDFSEIDYDAQVVFVNTILAPLNNWSNKFVRFKVAAYPKRIFYGDIDKGKIDEIHLDYYELYKVKDLPELEKKAMEFLDRLLKARFEYYLKVPFSEVFHIDSENTWDSYLELLFQASMNIPRVLGHILHYCHQSAILYQKRITKSLIEQAAQKYYKNQIKYYFDKTNFLKEAFDESLDRFSQQVLLNLLVDRAKELKQILAKETTELFRNIAKNRIPTSHFFINKEYERFLYSLELNYFVSKYYEQADRDGVVISIYSINFGLCREQNISFGRPQGHTKYRKYYISRHFNYDRILQQYLLEQKTFVCKSCGTEYPYSEAELLHKIGMLCYKGCKAPEVKEEYKFKDANLLNGMNTENLLPEIELDILHVLSQDKKAQLYASLIARELDCSHQLVTKRTQKLKSADLVERYNAEIDGKTRRVYGLTEKAEQLYFDAQNN